MRKAQSLIRGILKSRHWLGSSKRDVVAKHHAHKLTADLRMLTFGRAHSSAWVTWCAQLQCGGHFITCMLMSVGSSGQCNSVCSSSEFNVLCWNATTTSCTSAPSSQVALCKKWTSSLRRLDGPQMGCLLTRSFTVLCMCCNTNMNLPGLWLSNCWKQRAQFVCWCGTKWAGQNSSNVETSIGLHVAARTIHSQQEQIQASLAISVGCWSFV